MGKDLCSGLEAHQARAYLGFLEGMLVNHKATQALNSPVPIYKCLTL